MSTPRPFPQVRIIRRNVPGHPHTAFRNLLAFQSAIVRGRTSVVFHNANTLRQDMMDQIRVIIPRRHEPNRPYDWAFAGYRDPRESDYDERPAVRDVIPDQPWEGFELEWVKVLGEGGFGLATLWNVTYDDDSRERVVIKIPHQTDITGEAEWHLRYADASHVVQFLDIQERAREVRRRNFPGTSFSWEEEFNWRDMNVVLLEYAEHGSVYDMMSKVAFFNIDFPNRCLWEIWECFIKGVASVAWQPHLLQIPDSVDLLERALNSYDDPRRSHYSDFLRVCPMTHDVHFDLEEQNILVGQDDDHPHQPIFKLHDFGDYSHKMRQCWRDWREKDYWRWRRVPKRNRLAPETFTEDWDDIILGSGPENFQGEDLTKGYPIAGRYGTWTNLFQIAQVMQSMITKIYGFHPMVAGTYDNLDGTQSDATYGWRLMRSRYDHIELELKDLIMQCMYEKPSSRPSLDYLLRKIAERKARGFAETDDQVRRFWQRLAILRRDSQLPPPPDTDDEDDDDDESSPPSLSDGDSDYVPSNPPTPANNNNGGGGGGNDGNNRGNQRNRSAAPSPDTNDANAEPAAQALDPNAVERPTNVRMPDPLPPIRAQNRVPQLRPARAANARAPRVQISSSAAEQGSDARTTNIRPNIPQVQVPVQIPIRNHPAPPPRQPQAPVINNNVNYNRHGTTKKDNKKDNKKKKNSNKDGNHKKILTSYSLGSPVTRSTGIPTDVIRENLIAQFTPMPSSDDFDSREVNPPHYPPPTPPRSPLGSSNKRKLGILDDGPSEGGGRAKRAKIARGGLVGVDDLLARRERLDREMRERMERMDID